MFSDLYYLSKLIDASLSFTQVEKQNIFNHVKNNPDKIKDTIKVFEDERIWLEYIKNDYQKKLVNIWENYRNDLLEAKNKKKVSDIEKTRKKMKDMKVLEQNEKEEFDIDNLINQI